MLLDLQMQDGTGIDICRAVRAVKPEVSGLLLTASGDEEAEAAAVLAGAAGYLVKLNRGSDIVNAIRRLRADTSLLDADSVQRARRRVRRIIDFLDPAVTDAERSILELVITGHTDGQIAEHVAEDDAASGVDVPRLVGRVTQALLGRTPVSLDLGDRRT